MVSLVRSAAKHRSAVNSHTLTRSLQFEVLRKVDKAHDEGIWSVAWRRNSIITGSADGKIKCWNEQLEKRFEHDASPLGVVSVDMETFGACKSY